MGVAYSHLPRAGPGDVRELVLDEQADVGGVDVAMNFVESSRTAALGATMSAIATLPPGRHTRPISAVARSGSAKWWSAAAVVGASGVHALASTATFVCWTGPSICCGLSRRTPRGIVRFTRRHQPRQVNRCTRYAFSCFTQALASRHLEMPN